MIRERMLEQARAAKAAAQLLATLPTTIKNQVLSCMAATLQQRRDEILEANRQDVEEGSSKGLSPAMLDRLSLTPARFTQMVTAIDEIIALPDPVGDIIRMWRRPNNLQIGRMRVPLGVVAVIYEARPNVTVDTAALCLKSGNAVILRGGSEAIRSNLAIAAALKRACVTAGGPEGAIQQIETTDRRAITELLKLDRYIDVVIPRGGEELIRLVVEETRIPIIRHDKGLCHIYVDKEMDPDIAQRVVFNAKVQRPAVCNAMETLLVHQAVAGPFLPRIADCLRGGGVELRGCPLTLQLVPTAKPATEEDWQTEYLDLILSIRVVKDLEEAIQHIATYGSGLAEAIITNNYYTARQFIRRVDAAAVLVNTSTRFTDGNQFGLGAEMGISTQKLHVRGPVGLEDLTSLKYVVLGEGQVRE